MKCASHHRTFETHHYWEGIKVRMLWCYDCDECVPWGPANDADPNVAIEIRAAEIAADGGVYECHRMPDSGECAECGWVDWILNVEEPNPGDAWHAGYLARAIVEHDKEQS